MVRTKADKESDQDSCLSTTFTAPEEGQDALTTGRKRSKQGWNGGGEQCRRAAAMFYGLGSCSQPPTKSLFLPAMHCSLHLSHYAKQGC